jgi:phosphoenolpyruvate synthase/pyruvate phosphate dikinase
LYFLSSGTKEVEIDSSEAGKSCLDEKIALQLAALGIQLEKKFGSPRDIEFAIKQVNFLIISLKPTLFHV